MTMRVEASSVSLCPGSLCIPSWVCACRYSSCSAVSVFAQLRTRLANRLQLLHLQCVPFGPSVALAIVEAICVLLYLCAQLTYSASFSLCRRTVVLRLGRASVVADLQPPHLPHRQRLSRARYVTGAATLAVVFSGMCAFTRFIARHAMSSLVRSGRANCWVLAENGPHVLQLLCGPLSLV